MDLAADHRAISACRCRAWPDVFECGADSQSFRDSLVLVSTRQARQLFQCPRCAERWQFDSPSPSALAIRVAAGVDWAEFDDHLLRVRYLAERHGGFANDTCAAPRCSQPALKGVLLCATHAYPGHFGRSAPFDATSSAEADVLSTRRWNRLLPSGAIVAMGDDPE